jgi:DNA-binding beta-propeller fold protein YncE
MNSKTKLLTFVLVAGATAAAQSGRVTGPVVGLVMDASSRLRPVLGVPGAAYLDQPLSIDASIQVAAISPHQDYGLGLRGDTRDLVLVREPLGNSTISVIDGAVGTGRVILSRTGSAAILLAADGSGFRVLSGLPDAPSVAWQADLSGIANASGSIAVSDDGKAVLVAAADADHVSIFLITADAGPRVLATAGQLGGLAFVAGRTDALIGDAAANQVQIIRDVTGAASVAMISDTSGPLAVASSEDGRTIYIANTNPSGVLMVDSSSGAQQSIACDCTPTGLFPLSRGGVFRLTDPAVGDLWIFDGGTINPRIVVVPGDSLATGGAQ